MCRFAHQLSLTPQHLSKHLDHNNLDLRPLDPHDDDSNLRWKLMWRYCRAGVGFVFHEVESWEARPSTDTTGPLNWKERKTNHIERLMQWLCWQCPHPLWASKLLIGMNTTLMEAALNPVLITSVETSHGTYKLQKVTLPRLNPTTLDPLTGANEFFKQATTPVDPGTFWKNWTKGYRKALTGTTTAMPKGISKNS